MTIVLGCVYRAVPILPYMVVENIKGYEINAKENIFTLYLKCSGVIFIGFEI
jgi:hypothetical protein